MKEQLISFETAKLAKEKGFKKVKCNWYYDKSGNLQKEIDIDNLHRDGQYNKVSSPTQSLLQKWLRDIHDVNVCVELGSYSTKNKVIKEYKSVVFSWEYGEKYFNCFTYEEALEKGLQEALKLIK